MPWVGFNLPAALGAPEDAVKDLAFLLTTATHAQFLRPDLIGFGEFLFKSGHRCLIAGRYIIVTVDQSLNLPVGMPEDAWMSPSSDESDALQV